MANSTITLRSNWAWTHHNGWLQNVTISISGGYISNVETQNDPHKFVDCNSLLPGFVNSHCHLELSNLCGKLTPKQSFPAWVSELRKNTSSWESKDFIPGAILLIQFKRFSFLNFLPFYLDL